VQARTFGVQHGEIACRSISCGYHLQSTSREIETNSQRELDVESAKINAMDNPLAAQEVATE
jgi:hypothetical protein